MIRAHAKGVLLGSITLSCFLLFPSSASAVVVESYSLAAIPRSPSGTVYAVASHTNAPSGDDNDSDAIGYTADAVVGTLVLLLGGWGVEARRRGWAHRSRLFTDLEESLTSFGRLYQKMRLAKANGEEIRPDDSRVVALFDAKACVDAAADRSPRAGRAAKNATNDQLKALGLYKEMS